MIPTTAPPSARNVSTPSEAHPSFNNEETGNRVAAASAIAIASETEEAHEIPTFPSETLPPSSSMAVDIGPDTAPSPKREAPASFWSKLSKAANVVEEHLAEWFGLNDSKYQWAVDEAMNRQLAGDLQVKPAPQPVALNNLQTEPMSQQAMHRDTNEVDTV